LAIVRELWRWREDQAEKLNLPPRRVLRDDLLTELARRGTADPKRIRAVRGLHRRDLHQKLPQMSERIQRALDLPQSELPKRLRRNNSTHATVLAQFLSTALASMCRQQQIAPSLVGTVQDMRDLVAYRLHPTTEDKPSAPALAQGWRAEVVGRRVDDLLAGKLSIRIADPTSDQPLVFEPVDG
jgi:ribonuclease D